MKKQKGQTIICKTLLSKLKIELYKPHQKPGVNLGAPDGWDSST